MCGLAGLLHSPNAPLAAAMPAALVERMAAGIAHRGPDDSGSTCEPRLGLALAHRRLAVLDLSPAGHQPMASASGRLLIAFNGEIYNHLDLRRELEASGQAPAWRGHADTETLLAAIEAWGLPTALQRACGMWAFALLDRQQQQLQLVRDRFGEKPLSWGLVHHPHAPLLAFASELASLRAIPGFANPIDPEALASLLRWGCIPAPRSIHRDLRQLPPGHSLTIPLPWQPGHPLPQPQPWWDLQAEAAAAARSPIHNPAEALAATAAALQQAVERQTLADVPLGCFLSGGIDSSLITALLQRCSSRPVRSLTISFPDRGGGEAGFDEGPWARAVAAHLGTEHLEVALSAADALALIPSLARLYSEPFADSSQIPTHLVCRAARQHGLTVALSGDGGDELFGGYNRHRLAPTLLRRCGPLPPPLRQALAGALRHLPMPTAGLRRDKAQKLAAAIASAGSLAELHSCLTSLWPDPAALMQSPPAAPVPAAPLPAAASAAERLMLADALTYLPADILTKVDRAAMAVGLETRAPFLDHQVASLAWRLPLSFKIHGNQGKWILRQLLSRHLPHHLLSRPKAGFALPLGPWLRGPLRGWAEDLLDPRLLRRQGWLRPEPVQELWLQHRSGRADHTARLWAVLSWQAWLLEWG